MSEAATIFIEWVYANPGKAPEDYASRLAKLIENERAEEREACAQIADGWGDNYVAEAIAEAIRALPIQPKASLI